MGPTEVGRVRLRSAAVLRGYVGDLASGGGESEGDGEGEGQLIDPDATAAVLDDEGWVTTGDLGALGQDGNLRLVGRVSEMYIRGGYNVYPTEVEAVLGELPTIAQVAVVGAPDPVLGEIGAAFVVPSSPATPPTLEELRAACRQRLADYKAPDRLYLVVELPVTPMAKIDKRELAARAAEYETEHVKKKKKERVST
jgi:acyl-CoA synthetase (AMP-forming)/AMP-acid ligase II